jgi:hypothetical protein
MAQAKLNDITLWLWRFYLRRHGHDPSENLRQHWQKFHPILNDAVRWAGEGKSDVFEYDDNPDSWQMNVRLAGVPWHNVGETLRSLDVRAMLDVFYVESGIAKTGPAIPQDILLLKQNQWRSDSDNEWFVGQATCLSAEFGQLGEDDAKKLSQEILEHWFDKPHLQLELIKFDFGFLSVPVDSKDEIIVLLIEEGSLRKAETVVHLILPQLYTARLKAPITIGKLKRELLPAAHQIEAALVRELDQIAKRPQRLRVLEQSSYSLSHWQVQLGDIVSQCEEELATLRVNGENVERVLQDKLLSSQKTILDALLAAPLRLQIEQIESDLRYLTITQVRAERVLHGIGTMAEVRSVRWQRTITIMFGAFVWFGVSQMFPEIIAWPKKWRLAGLFGTLIVLFVIDWLLSRPQESIWEQMPQTAITAKTDLTAGQDLPPPLLSPGESLDATSSSSEIRANATSDLPVK